jgi:hypothetical protein
VRRFLGQVNKGEMGGAKNRQPIVQNLGKSGATSEWCHFLSLISQSTEPYSHVTHHVTSKGVTDHMIGHVTQTRVRSRDLQIT